jgi:hypothetical protein
MAEITIPEGMSVEQYVRKKFQAQALALQEECFEFLSTQNASYTQKADYLKYAMKAGDLEPKQAITAQGTGFSIRIVLTDDREEQEKIVSGVTIDAALPATESPPIYMTPSLATDQIAQMSEYSHE